VSADENIYIDVEGDAADAQVVVEVEPMSLQKEIAEMLKATQQRFSVSNSADPARAEGFSDCEELIAQWLEKQACEADRHTADPETMLMESCILRARARVLREAALAIRLGQHRREVES